MLSTKLTATDNQILSNASIPTILRSLIERRTNNKRMFGRLEINVPDITAAAATATAGGDIISKIIAGFLLDTSGSMQGRKLENAVNTIKQFAEILLSERDGKTVASHPIKSWIYVITFNSDAELVIPFQEITAESLPNIFTQLDQIRTSGSTNYERAFKKQTEVIADIIRGFRREDNPPTADDDATPYHLIRFFETDGEITEGMRSEEILYKMMRDTGDTTDATATPQLTFEDYILGYGTDVDLNCLQNLASPYQRSEYLLLRSHANRKPQYTDAYNCSSLITIVKPEDIGWQVGELLFKVIMRYGYKVQVSVATTAAATTAATAADVADSIELFEYQTHQWSNTTTLHSMIHGEKKVLYIQYTPPTTDTDDTDADSDTPPVIVVVKIQYSNQSTGATYTYEFEHMIKPASVPDLPSIAATAAASVPDLPVPIIIGMIQIEIFKQFREIEHNDKNREVRYDKDTIVREAYKTIRMLKSLYQPTEITRHTHQSPQPHQSMIENLITDVKVIIGLTTINDAKEKTAILHARRIASGEQDIFNTGASVSRKYVENEEDYEEDAEKVIKAHRESSGDQHDNDNDNDNGAHADAEDYADDGIPSRIPTVINTPYSQNQDNGQYQRGRSSSSCDSGSSLLRTLCARIAMAKKRKEDLTIDQLYDQVKRYGSAAGYNRYGGNAHHDEFDLYGHADDTFSSTPMNDENTQRRMGMMRQMSSNSQPSA